MSEVLTIAFDQESRELIARMQSAPADMLAAIARGLDRGAAIVTGKITRSRFTGKGPFPVSEHRLGVRTNRLRSSLRWSAAAVTGGSTVAGSIGSNVEYAGVHEYGFAGEVQVRSFRRGVSPTQFVVKGGSILPGSRKNKALRKEALGMETVRAHRRRMNVPARAPLGTGLRENLPTFAEQIGKALAAAWQKRGAR